MSVSIVSAGPAGGDTQPLRWWSDEQQRLVVAEVEKVSRDWMRDWGLAQLRPEGDEVRCAMAFEESGAAEAASCAWKPVSPAGETGQACAMWWDARPLGRAVSPSARAGGVARKQLEADMLPVLMVALFGSASEPSATSDAGAVAEVASDAAKAAWADFWQRIRRGLLQASPVHSQALYAQSLGDTLPRPAMFQTWSGAVIVSLHWCGQDMKILLGGMEVEAFLRQRHAIAPARTVPHAAVVPVWEAVSALPCTVRAELEPVELSVGTIKGLRVGDVIELSHPLDRPALARTAAGELLCEAYLGKAGAHRAIELMRSPAGSL